MSLIDWAPWMRAWAHAERALQEDRGLHTIAMLFFTSLPVLAAYAYAFSAAWLLGSSLTALFLMTLGDCNPHLIATYIFAVPPWLASKGFRRSIATKDDGSCFFDAVRLALGKTEQEVRNAIADWIDTHKDADNVNPTYQSQSQGDANYTQKIRSADLHVWGNTLEAMAVAQVYGVEVHVHSAGGSEQVFGSKDQQIHLYFTPSVVNGCANHYRLLAQSFFDNRVRL